jgi:hypothetical protein
MEWCINSKFLLQDMSAKKLILASILLIVSGKVFTQKKHSPEVLQLPSNCHDIKFEGSKNQLTTTLPFSRIFISDSRFDTSKIGYYEDRKKGQEAKLCVAGGLSDNLSKFLNSCFNANFSQSKSTIHAFVKNFWVSKEIPLDKYDQKQPGYNLSLKIEFYLQNEECFFPLFRFDSTETVYPSRDNSIDKLINDFCLRSTKKLFEPVITSFQKKKCVLLSQIDSFNTAQKNIPVLVAKEIKQGIYLNFDQFKENKPAFIDFETSFSPASDVLYVKGSILKDSAITDAWGFSDGKNIFIRQGFNFFPLVRCGNNFEFYAFEKITTSSIFYGPTTSNSGSLKRSAIEAGVTGLLSSIRTKSKDTYLYLLDMESGKIR